MRYESWTDETLKDFLARTPIGNFVSIVFPGDHHETRVVFCGLSLQSFGHGDPNRQVMALYLGDGNDVFVQKISLDCVVEFHQDHEATRGAP